MDFGDLSSSFAPRDCDTKIKLRVPKFICGSLELLLSSKGLVDNKSVAAPCRGQ